MVAAQMRAGDRKMADKTEAKPGFGEDEQELLTKLRAARRKQRTEGLHAAAAQLTAGQRIADTVAATMGSWRFIIIQTTILVLWIALNITAWINHWDPYPFILLNLALSFQAAYAAPFIMMSQNRQQDVDRRQAADDFHINVKAELEIELLHEKLDELRDKEVLALTDSIKSLTALLEKKGKAAAG
jgi:uncharacterized membrane protein